MKVTLHLSSTALITVVGLIVALLLVTDIFAHRAAPQVMTQTPAAGDRVIAKEFVLQDDSGRTRARIAMNEYDAPCLQMFDRNGQPRAQLRLNRDDVPSLRLYDEKGKLRSVNGFVLGMMEPGLILFDDFGSGHLIGSLAPDAASTLQIADEDRMQGDSLPYRYHFYNDRYQRERPPSVQIFSEDGDTIRAHGEEGDE